MLTKTPRALRVRKSHEPATRRGRPTWSRPSRRSRAAAGLAGGALVLGAAAAFVQARTRQAEAENPPVGRFVEAGGIRLHYTERGQGEPLVLLHGNGALIQDFALSGLVDLAARKYRVIVFDRPGFGYSERPRHRQWTPEAQARLFREAFGKLGIERPIVVGHSWGTLVALALGLDHPRGVKSLVLLSGYYFPTIRADVPFLAAPALPVIGDLMRFTVSPLLGRLMWPGILRKLFGPNPVPEPFERFPKWMALRPGQIRAAAEETAMMIPAAARLRTRYARLTLPVVLVAGEEDRIADCEYQTEALGRELPDSTVHVVPGAGPMVHHVAPRIVLRAIDEAAGQ